MFVGSVCAIGACMIIYRGRSDTEDGLLNLSGYLAFFVAFVPTPLLPTDAGSATPADVTAAVVNNSWSILIAGAIGLALQWALARAPDRSRRRPAAVAVSVVIYAALLGFFLGARQAFLDTGHYVAAVGLFLGVVGVVGVNAIALARARASAGRDRLAQWSNLYTMGFVLMILTIVIVVVAVRPWVEQWVFWLEALLIAQFLAFWITQTVERWRIPEPLQDRFVPG